MSQKLMVNPNLECKHLISVHINRIQILGGGKREHDEDETSISMEAMARN